MSPWQIAPVSGTISLKYLCNKKNENLSNNCESFISFDMFLDYSIF